MNKAQNSNWKTSFPTSHRQREILDELRRSGGSLRVQALAQALSVTEETIRRNIKILDDAGIVARMYGGVRLHDEFQEGDFQERYNENPDAKKRIARQVAQMVPSQNSIFLDIGSTTAFIADSLCDHFEMLVVTNSVYVAYKLATRNHNRLFLAGGELRSHDGGAFGADAIKFVENFQVNTAILSTAAINANNGFMLHDLDEANFSRSLIANASKSIIAADSSKFGREAPITAFEPSQIDYLVTDKAPPADIVESMRKWKIEIVIAE